MTRVLDQLHTDHRNLEKVLRVLEQELAKYDTENTRDADTPDLLLIMDIMDYMHTYPEFYHHPLEEAAFDCLEARNLASPSKTRVIRSDHDQLEREGNELRSLVRRIHFGQPVAIEQLHQALNDYTWHMREHMRKEEELVFPLFERLDEAADRAILDTVEHRRDPVFDEYKQEQYSALLERLNGLEPV